MPKTKTAAPAAYGEAGRKIKKALNLLEAELAHYHTEWAGKTLPAYEIVDTPQNFDSTKDNLSYVLMRMLSQRVSILPPERIKP